MQKKTRQVNKLYKVLVIAIATYIMVKYVVRGIEQDLKTIESPDYLTTSMLRIN